MNFKPKDMHLVPKVNRTLVFLAEMLRKLRRWYVKKKNDHVQRVNGRLGEVWPQEFVWASEMLFNEEEIGCSLKIRTSVLVCAAQPSSTLRTLPVRTFWVIKEKKEADYIFIHQCCRLSQLCNTTAITVMPRTCLFSLLIPYMIQII